MPQGNDLVQDSSSWSVKWPVTLFITLVLIGAFCFVGGVAWQQFKDRTERREAKETGSDLKFESSDQIRATVYQGSE